MTTEPTNPDLPQKPDKPLRASALDALRGYAILTMVLSGTMATAILPKWMAHAQVPPPTFKFDPTIFGITWVDLVFPFFLFAMGAAFPFSIGKKLNEKNGRVKAILSALGRGVQLTFFAIFIQHMYPWVLSSPQDMSAWFTTLFAFALLFPMFMRLPDKYPQALRIGVKVAAYGLAIILLNVVTYANDRTFTLGFSNIIILVLANMAIFGSIAYIFTYKNRLARLAILPFVMAVFLGSTTEGSWVQWFYNFSPLPWMYKFYYLKYLFIIIPGTIAGEYLMDWMKNRQLENQENANERKIAGSMIAITVALVVCNLYGLFTRQLVLNLVLTTGLLSGGLYLLRKKETSAIELWNKFFKAGAYLLLLGLFFEAYEGGIRKDHSTYSYYFVCSGLAFMALIFFSVVCDFFQGSKKYFRFLVGAGQNPMIAYVGTNLLVMPLINILGLAPSLTWFDTNPWLGFLKGVITTVLVTLVTLFFTRIKWFWRT